MARLVRLPLLLAAIGVARLAGAQAAGAQSADPAAEAAPSARWTNEKRAVRLGHEALALYEASRWDDAYQRFHAAQELVHSPVFLLYMARCRRNSGKFIDAADRFERVARERVADDAPPAWHGAVADAAAELIALRRSIPRVVVVVRGRPDSRLTLDGRELPAASLGKELPLDPGRHAIVARDASGRRVVRTFEVAGGQATTTVDVSFQAAAPARPEAVAPAGDASFWRGAGLVFLGVGVAGLGAGAGAAIVAAGRDGSARDDWRAGATVGLAAGAAVAGTGVLLLLLNAPGADAAL
jgi:hypothetical protein